MINTIISYHKAMKYYNIYEDPDLASDDSLKSNNSEDNLGQLSIVMRVLVLGIIGNKEYVILVRKAVLMSKISPCGLDQSNYIMEQFFLKSLSNSSSRSPESCFNPRVSGM